MTTTRDDSAGVGTTQQVSLNLNPEQALIVSRALLNMRADLAATIRVMQPIDGPVVTRDQLDALDTLHADLALAEQASTALIHAQQATA